MKLFLFLTFILVPTLVRSDALRDALLRGQIGDADRGLGIAMENVFLTVVNWFPRISVWNFRTWSYEYNSNAPKKPNFKTINWGGVLNFTTDFELPNFQDYQGTSTKYSKQFFTNNDIPNFIQGMVFTLIGGLIPLIFTILWMLVLCCTCAICCCKCCCCRSGISTNHPPQKYRKIYKRRRCCTCFCRISIVLFSILSLICMGVWGLFAFQSHIGISNSFNVLEEKYDTIIDFSDSIFEVPANVNEVFEELEVTFNDTVKELIKILPIGDALLPHIQCVKDIIASLPSLDVLDDFVISVNESLSDPPPFDQFDVFAANITYWIDKMAYTDLVLLKTMLTDIIDLLDSFPLKLEELNVELESIDVMKDSFPNNEDMLGMRRQLDKIDNVQTNVLTDDFFNGFAAQLDDLSGYPGNEIAANIRKFQGAINVLNTIDFDILNSTLFKFKDAKENTPDIGRMLEIIEEINEQMSEIDISAVDGPLKSLNDSIYGLIAVVSTIDEIVVDLNETIVHMIPDFSPLINELGKIEITISTASCIKNITQMIVDFNNSVLILPAEMSAMINQISDMENMLNEQINFNDVIGSIDGMLSVVDGQIQSAIGQVSNISIDSMLDQLPNLGDIGGDLQNATGDFSSGADSFNVSSMEESMGEMNQTISDMEDVDSYIVLIGDVKNSTVTAVEKNETIGSFASELEDYGNGVCPHPCNALNPKAMMIKGLLTDIKSSSDSVPVDDMYDVVDSFNSTKDDLPDSSEYTDKIAELNETLSSLPDMSGILDQILAANDTLGQDLPFKDFSNYIATFSESLDSFDLDSITGSLDEIGPLYDQINQSDIFDQFGMLDEMVNPMLAEIPALFATFTTQIVSINETFNIVKQMVEMIGGYKDMAMNDYVYKYDGYRLLGALLVILIFIPIPSLTCFSLCCFRKPGGLLCFSLGLILIATLFFIFPTIGIPVGIVLDEGCNNVESYVSSGVNAIGDVADSLNLTQLIGPMASMFDFNVSDIIANGLSPDVVNELVNSQLGAITELMPNMTMDLTLNFNFEPIMLKELLINYISRTAACDGDDILVVGKSVFNSSIFTIMDGVRDMLLEFEIMGFRVHPKFPTTLRDIFQPILLNLTDLFDLAEPILGCENLNSVYRVGYDILCDQFRYSFMFLWGILGICAAILLVITIVSCCSYCCFCCNYYSSEDYRNDGYPPNSSKSLGLGKEVVVVQQKGYTTKIV